MACEGYPFNSPGRATVGNSGSFGSLRKTEPYRGTQSHNGSAQLWRTQRRRNHGRLLQGWTERVAESTGGRPVGLHAVLERVLPPRRTTFKRPRWPLLLRKLPEL